MTKRYWKQMPLVLLPFLAVQPLPSWAQAKSLDGEGANGQAVNLAVVVEGQVSVKRKGWTSYEPVVFGTNLQPGDLLRVGESSRAKVVCSDITLRDVQVGTLGVPCVVSQPLLRRPNGSTINVTRGWPDDGSSPIVLSPRKTKLLSTHPLLRWKPVTGVTTYRVIVRGGGLDWRSQVKGTQLVYPETAPRLVPGTYYKLVVETSDRSSGVEPGHGLGFSVLDSKDRKPIDKEEGQIKALGLPDGPTQFLIAHLYATNGLNADAIQRLEGISTTFKVAAVERLLGGLYLEVGLTRQAEAIYLQSLDLSKEEKDEEGQILAHLALAHIYDEALGNTKLATQHLGAALALANSVGDKQLAGQTEERLAKLK